MRVAYLFDCDVLRIAAEFIGEPSLIGLALFVLPPFAIMPSSEQPALAFIAVEIWCYYDSAFTRGNWPRAILEAGIWFFLATKSTQALLLFFGSTEGA